MSERIKILKERVRAGMDRELAEAVYERYVAGGKEGVLQAMQDELADRALQRYQGKIVAAFGRAGVYLDPDEPLSVAGLIDVINTQTGLEIGELSIEGVSQAVDRLISARLSAMLKVEITTVMDSEALKAQLMEAAKLAIQDGRAAKFLEKGIIMAARKAATFKRAGIGTTEEQKRIMSRVRQKRFRRAHRMVWVD